jgi:signal transduction histidine kinase
MGGLGMAVDLILQDPANAVRVARLRKQVVTEIARLRDVTDALLSFSRSPRIDRQPQELGLLIRNAVGLLGDVIADRHAEVRVETDGPLPVTCDGHKIQSVVMNLVKNAVEAGKTVVVRARAEDAEAIVEVADDGPGLSADARSHLFEPFFTTKPNGTGLGLPTSQRFVEAHGGRIESATAPQGGALFRVMLPREARAA